MTSAEYVITASGCDDKTEVIVHLTDAEADFVRRLAAEINAASAFDCQPRLAVVRADDMDAAEPSELRASKRAE